MLFYNCLSDLGKEKFKPLIEKYGLFGAFDSALLLSPEHKAMYAPTAYDEKATG